MRSLFCLCSHCLAMIALHQEAQGISRCSHNKPVGFCQVPSCAVRGCAGALPICSSDPKGVKSRLRHNLPAFWRKHLAKALCPSPFPTFLRNKSHGQNLSCSWPSCRGRPFVRAGADAFLHRKPGPQDFSECRRAARLAETLHGALRCGNLLRHADTFLQIQV